MLKNVSREDAARAVMQLWRIMRDGSCDANRLDVDSCTLCWLRERGLVNGDMINFAEAIAVLLVIKDVSKIYEPTAETLRDLGVIGVEGVGRAQQIRSVAEESHE